MTSRTQLSLALPLLLAGCVPSSDDLATLAHPLCGAIDLTNETGVTATASSAKGGKPASKAIDNSTAGFWESTSCSGQWLQVDLGASRTVSGVSINWDYNYASAFTIQVSATGTSWATALSAQGTSGADQDDYTFAAQVTRYVRIVASSCGVSSSGAGGAATISVNELQVLGDLSATCGGSSGGGTCSDGVLNQDETGIDCGGVCPACQTATSCTTHGACASGWCDIEIGLCGTPSCSDGYRNQGEVAIDCGGPCGTCATGAACAGASGSGKPGFACVWNDEFSGSAVDQSIWTFQNLNVNNEKQNYTNRECSDPAHSANWNYCVANGQLTIRARNDGMDCSDSRRDSDDQPDNADCALDWNQSRGATSYTSGRLISKEWVKNGVPVGRAERYGYVEFRARLPQHTMATPQSGLWPALWLLGQNINEGPINADSTMPWPGCGEVDVMEWKSPSNHMGANVIWKGGDNTTDACSNWPDGGETTCGGCINDVLVGGVSYDEPCAHVIKNGSRFYWDGQAPFSHTAWHTYGLLWTESYMELFIDGIKQSSFYLDASSDEFNKDMFVILNLAVGGDLGGTVAVTDWSTATLEVDYVRWYQRL